MFKLSLAGHGCQFGMNTTSDFLFQPQKRLVKMLLISTGPPFWHQLIPPWLYDMVSEHIPSVINMDMGFKDFLALLVTGKKSNGLILFLSKLVHC